MSWLTDFLREDKSHIHLEWDTQDKITIKEMQFRIKELEWENFQLKNILANIRRIQPNIIKENDFIKIKSRQEQPRGLLR